MKRFEVRENTPNSFGVYDNDAKKYHRLIDTAVSIYMRKEAAEQICEIMNKEWEIAVFYKEFSKS